MEIRKALARQLFEKYADDPAQALPFEVCEAQVNNWFYDQMRNLTRNKDPSQKKRGGRKRVCIYIYIFFVFKSHFAFRGLAGVVFFFFFLVNDVALINSIRNRMLKLGIPQKCVQSQLSTALKR
jgi:hypothetical protein